MPIMGSLFSGVSLFFPASSDGVLSRTCGFRSVFFRAFAFRALSVEGENGGVGGFVSHSVGCTLPLMQR